MKKMFFPKFVNVKGTDFLAGEVNEVEETSGSINRWLIRGCTIVEDKCVIVEECECDPCGDCVEQELKEKVEEVVEEAVEDVVKKPKSKKKK